MSPRFLQIVLKQDDLKLLQRLVIETLQHENDPQTAGLHRAFLCSVRRALQIGG